MGSIINYTIPKLSNGASFSLYATCQTDTCISSPALFTGIVQPQLPITQSLSPQENIKVLPPSPTAANFARYGEIPVNYHTGLTNQSIPIYTVKSKDVSLDLSLSYHGSGNKVGDVASWVGLGWSLNAGGVITRTVQGSPDEGFGAPYSIGYYARNYFSPTLYPLVHNGQFSTTKKYGIPRPPDYQSSPTNCNPNGGTPNPFDQNWDDALNGKIDTEPDLFYFNIGGYSGKFMFDTLRVAHFFPEQDVKVSVVYTPDGGNSAEKGTFNQFILTIPNGTKYYFGGTHGVNNFNQGIDAVEKTSSGATYPVTTSWYLTKIESADSQSSIMLAYQSEKSAYFDLTQEKFTSQSGTTFPTSYTLNKFDGVRLSNIYTSENNIQIVFQATTLRQDVGEYVSGEYNPSLSEAKALDRILITNGTNGNPLNGFRQFIFSYNYFYASQGNLDNHWKPSYHSSFFQADTKRLKLLSLQEKSWDGTTQMPPYEFEYNTSIPFPRRLCYSRDHWGYYNGNEFGGTRNNSLLHVFNNDGINGVPSNYVPGMWISNRTTNSNYVGFGALTKITYPTKGYTTFDYGVHQSGSNFIGGLRIAAINNFDNNGAFIAKKQFDYLSSGILFSRPTYFYTAAILGTPPVGANCPPAPTPCFPNPTCPLNFLSSTSLLPLQSTQGNHFGYREVKVLESNGTANTNGYALYTYNMNVHDNNMYPNSYDDFGVLRITNYPPNPLRENYLQGTLALEEIVNQNNKVLKKVSYNYLISSKKIIIPAMRAEIYINPSSNVYPFYNFYGFTTGRSELRSKTTTICDENGNNCAVSTEHYEYGSPNHFQMTRSSQPSSWGDSLITKIKYTADYTVSLGSADAASEGIRNAKNANIITPVEQVNIRKYIDNSQKVIGGSLTYYHGTYYKPFAKYGLELESPLELNSFVHSSVINANPATFQKDPHYPPQADVFYTFDSKGNLSEVYEPQGSTNVRTYLWGYGSGYPIAEIRNANFSTVQSALTPSVVDNLRNSNTLTPAQIQSQLNPVFGISNTLAQIYTYEIPNGVKTITSSNGLLTSYNYDALGRLSYSTNHENEIIDKVGYQYANGCSTPAPTISSTFTANPCSVTLTATACSGTVNWNNGQTGSSITVSTNTVTSYWATCTVSGCTSANSNTLSIPSLPNSWLSSDVGAPPVAGCTKWDGSTLTLRGTGAMGGANDNFHWVYKPMSGDVTLIAKIDDIANVDGMRSGLIFRSSANTNADFVEFIIDGNGKVGKQKRRSGQNNNEVQFVGFAPDGSNVTPLNNTWLKLEKIGNTIRAYVKNTTNILNWQEVVWDDATDNDLGSNFLIGFTSRYNNTSVTNTTTFSNITVNGVAF
ncbi:hypothetical protein [Emticicia agri]|uniref:Uncharacterized protein n=1 Tax=Emticicia agri TaxID=2492393 RepID=A0A4V1ZCL0_9BACT|nr:hypothetical protein [Emticicia agri]RYU93030.1 hypothetical protein EWM59_24075 [Emticicia agri]